MSEKINKGVVVSFRLSEADFLPYAEKLASSNMKKSEFFREVFLKSKVNLTVNAAPSKDVERLTFLFNKASNNLNQIAHRANSAHLSGRISEPLYININNALISIRQLLLSEVKDVD